MDLTHETYQILEPGQEVATSGEILRYAATAFPDKIGLIDGERHWSFSELDALANQFAQAVLAQFGDQLGPVGIIGKNSAEYFIAHFGAARTGGYSINFPTRCSISDLIYTVNLTKPALIVVDEECVDLVVAAQEGFEVKPLYISIGANPIMPSNDFWNFIESRPSIIPIVEIDPEGPGTIIFTGGTTGQPKATISSQRARAISAMAGVEDFRIESNVVAGYSVPFTHTAGLCSWMQPAVLAGCSGIIIPKWDPENFMALTEQHGISLIFAVPSQLAVLLDHPAFEPERLRSIERIIFGGAPLSKSLIERAEALMPWMYCGRAYGSTETGHLAAQIKSDRDAVFDAYNQPGGRLEMEIFTSPGVVAEIGETGEVATRGPHLFTEYLGNEDAKSAFYKSDETDGEWGWMGDLAIKHDGYFTLVGRSKHVILSGGLNIYPAELEDILLSHSDVADCVVFGLEDATWGEIPAAAIVPLTEEVEHQEVLDFVAGQVAGFKQIRKLFVLPQIARTAAGKARVDEIREKCLQMKA